MTIPVLLRNFSRKQPAAYHFSSHRTLVTHLLSVTMNGIFIMTSDFAILHVMYLQCLVICDVSN